MKDQIYDPHFKKTFQDRKSEDFQRSFSIEIYAVGKDVETALNAIGNERVWGKLDGIEFQEVDTPCKWHVRFKANGTSMKAAGEYVTGGVIVTWWK